MAKAKQNPAPPKKPASAAAAPAAPATDPAAAAEAAAKAEAAAAAEATAKADAEAEAADAEAAAKAGVKGLRISAAHEGFRRAGRAWSKAPVDVPLADLSDDQVAMLRADALITVEEITIEAAAA